MKINAFDRFFSSFWWLPIFLLLCFIFFEQGEKKRGVEYSRLSAKIKELETIRQNLLADQKKMTGELNSQSDPAWVELTLMKVLGVVPENQTKVFFRDD